MDLNKLPLCELFPTKGTTKLANMMLAHESFDYSKNELIEMTGFTRQTLDRVIKPLLKFGAVKISRTVDRAKMYQWDKDSKVAKQIVGVVMAMSSIYAEEALKEQDDTPVIGVYDMETMRKVVRGEEVPEGDAVYLYKPVE